MRHANITTTMNIYTRALTPAKRQASIKAGDVLFQSRPATGNGAVRQEIFPYRPYAFGICSQIFRKLLKDMVGTSGFEPLTSTVSID